jgi:hypothetical protein
MSEQWTASLAELDAKQAALFAELDRCPLPQGLQPKSLDGLEAHCPADGDGSGMSSGGSPGRPLVAHAETRENGFAAMGTFATARGFALAGVEGDEAEGWRRRQAAKETEKQALREAVRPKIPPRPPLRAVTHYFHPTYRRTLLCRSLFRCVRDSGPHWRVRCRLSVVVLWSWPR